MGLVDIVSLKLENKGSVARDHLANERTYLAWIRTSLSLVTVGVAVQQLYNISADLDGDGVPDTNTQSSISGRILGVSFVVMGMIFVVIGLYRYFSSQFFMTKGKFPVSRSMVSAGAAATLALLIGLLVSILKNDD